MYASKSFATAGTIEAVLITICWPCRVHMSCMLPKLFRWQGTRRGRWLAGWIDDTDHRRRNCDDNARFGTRGVGAVMRKPLCFYVGGQGWQQVASERRGGGGERRCHEEVLLFFRRHAIGWPALLRSRCRAVSCGVVCRSRVKQRRSVSLLGLKRCAVFQHRAGAVCGHRGSIGFTRTRCGALCSSSAFCRTMVCGSRGLASSAAIVGGAKRRSGAAIVAASETNELGAEYRAPAVRSAERRCVALVASVLVLLAAGGTERQPV